MKFAAVPLAKAEGMILGHNIAGPNGRRLLRKGKPLHKKDILTLRELGRKTVYVARLEEGDIGEDEAARRIAKAVQGEGARILGPASGRANLLSTTLGVLRVDIPCLHHLNGYEGVTLATLRSFTPVQPREMVATIKIIPYALPARVVEQIEVLVEGNGAVIEVKALQPQPVSLIFSGSSSIHERLDADFAPLRQRVEALGSEIVSRDYIPLEEEQGEFVLSAVLRQRKEEGDRLILIAGETAIMDREDIVPRAVLRAGGQVECVGVPVDPGNLLMLGYMEDVPILGVPGCARSRKTNIVDWVLPRLLLGDRLTREELIRLGHGGLLEDTSQRPMPRAEVGRDEVNRWRGRKGTGIQVDK
jgi:molybdenum cofactor cytidylyltransferase